MNRLEKSEPNRQFHFEAWLWSTMLYCTPVRGKGAQRGRIGLKMNYFCFVVFPRDEPNTSGSSFAGDQDWTFLGFWEGMQGTHSLWELTLSGRSQKKGSLEGDQKLLFNSCSGPCLSCSPLLNNLISPLWKALSCYGNEYSININRIKPNTISPC